MTGDVGKPARPVGAQTGLIARVQRAWGPGPLQSAKMKGPAPDRVLVTPQYPRSVDLTLAQMLMTKSVALGNQKIDLSHGPEALWTAISEKTSGIEALQRFEWLGGFAHLHRQSPTTPAPDANRNHPAHFENEDSGTAAQASAIALTRGWLDSYERWSPQAWSPIRVADRLLHLCCHADFLLPMGDTLWRSRLLNCMARQTRHLAQTAHKAAPGEDMLITALGLLLAGLCIPACDVAIERGQELTRREFRLQIRPDGGHISRNPSFQLEIAIRIQMIANAYAERGLAMPGHIRLTLTRMACLCEFFRCGDGKLAVFNGGCEDDPNAIIAAGQAIDPDAGPLGFARYTRFQRLSAARALLIADVSDGPAGLVPGLKRRGSNFDSAGSIHFSSGRSRIIVNCGEADYLGEPWPDALRQAGAHSCFSLEGDPGLRDGIFAGETQFQRAEEVSGVLLEINRPFSERFVDSAHISESPENARADADDRGYFRRLYLAAGGDDFRGEDRLTGLPGRFAQYWRIRFHLHPSVKASLARDGQSVILVLPNQEGWRFRTSFDKVRLEKSIYFGAGGRMAHTDQIVIGPSDTPDESEIEQALANTSPDSSLDRDDSRDIIVKWALKRLDGV